MPVVVSQSNLVNAYSKYWSLRKRERSIMCGFVCVYVDVHVGVYVGVFVIIGSFIFYIYCFYFSIIIFFVITYANAKR